MLTFFHFLICFSNLNHYFISTLYIFVLSYVSINMIELVNFKIILTFYFLDMLFPSQFPGYFFIQLLHLL
ncbi:hypothetical protein C1645_265217 [Glomus cerebriforme]|uniref:Uncharacterized protein n=1 Tax=Glomus cerebriforme TaxID=658196 RepID=A0A397SVH0_9GLOM|nr:hypothetical protein C1645_265217 [Glomus cerebriforme]